MMPDQDQDQDQDLDHDLDLARVVRHTVTDEADEGERADVVLGRRIPALSRRQARTLARAGKLRVDGRRTAPAARVHAGQVLELELHGGSSSESPDELGVDDLEVLAVTERFVYVSKPAGIHTVALTPDQPGVLATIVAQRWPECAAASEDPREGGAVHRLDQPTSGVVAFARSRETWTAARAGFGAERVAKHYLAVCDRVAGSWPPALPDDGLRGWIEPAEPLAGFEDQLAAIHDPGSEPAPSGVRVRAALGRDGGDKRSGVRLDGRRASTVVQPLAISATDDRWLLRILLETGRRHQARVHLAWIGLPIVGDRVYGLVGPATSAIHLHAFALDLSGVFPDELAVFAPPPSGFWPAAPQTDDPM